MTSPREGAYAKGRRYLTEGRLILTKVDGDDIRSTCRGDSGEVYRQQHYAGRWFCSCPAKTRCSHVVALQLVTVRRRTEERP